MKTWPKPYKVHVKVASGNQVFEDFAFYDHQSHARMRMRDLAELNDGADDVVVTISRQRRLRGDFGISEERLAIWYAGRLRTTTSPAVAPSLPEEKPPASADLA